MRCVQRQVSLVLWLLALACGSNGASTGAGAFPDAGAGTGGTAGAYNGGGGAGGEVLTESDPWEILHAAPALSGAVLLDDGYLYFTTEQTVQPDYATDVIEYTIWRMPKEGGAPEPVVTSEASIIVVTKDDAAWYVLDRAVGSVRRVAFGTSTLQEFANAGSANGSMELLAQTASTFYFGYHPSTWDSTRIYALESPSSESVWWTGVPGSVGAVRVAGSTMYLVVDDNGPMQVQLALSDGAVEVQHELPDLCYPFFANPLRDGWLAVCGESAPFDIVEIDPSGAPSALATGMVSRTRPFVEVHGTTMYWTDDGTLYWYDLAADVDGSVDIGESAPFAFDAEYVYVVTSLLDPPVEIGRVPLSGP